MIFEFHEYELPISNSIKLILIKTSNNEIVAIHETENLEALYTLLRNVYGVNIREFEQLIKTGKLIK